MSLKTAVECPHCKNVGQTTRVIQNGAKLRCSQCRRVFRYGLVESDTEDALRSIGDMEIRELRKFITPPNESPRVAKHDKSNDRYLGVTNAPFASNSPTPAVSRDQPNDRSRRPTIPPLVEYPLAPASERSKDVLMGGKPVRFENPRNYMSAALIVLLMFTGYQGAMWTWGWITYLDTTGEIIQTDKNNRFLAEPDKSDKKSPNPKTVVPPDPEPRTAAGNASRTNDLEVHVTEAREAVLEQFNNEKRLLITLCITNSSGKYAKYPCWSHPANGLILRSLNPDLKRYELKGPEGKTERVMKPEEKVLETLIFSPTPRTSALELELPLWGGLETFQFSIPAEFIQRM